MNKDILPGLQSGLYCALNCEEIAPLTPDICCYFLSGFVKSTALDFSYNWQGHQRFVSVSSALNYLTFQPAKEKTLVYFSKSPNLS